MSCNGHEGLTAIPHGADLPCLGSFYTSARIIRGIASCYLRSSPAEGDVEYTLLLLAPLALQQQHLHATRQRMSARTGGRRTFVCKCVCCAFAAFFFSPP